MTIEILIYGSYEVGLKLNERFELIKADIGNKTVQDIGYCGWYSRHKDEAPDELEGWRHNKLDTKDSMRTISISGNSPRDITLVDIDGTKMNLHLDFKSSIVIKHKSKKYSAFSIIIDNMSINSKRLTVAASLPLKLLTRGMYIRFGHYYSIQKFIERIPDDKMLPITGDEGEKCNGFTRANV